ncbi:hypothetical protein [Nocardioides humi]|nr:hypothetical protein [Nocardioides humi]
MSVAAGVALFGLAINAVLIQTVMTDPDSSIKQVVRTAVVLLAIFALFVGRTWVPAWIVILAVWSTSLMLLRGNIDQLSVVFVLLLTPVLWSLPERKATKLAWLASLVSLGLVLALLLAGVTHDSVLEFRGRHTFGTQGVPFFFNLVYGAASLVVLYAFKYRLRTRFLTLALILAIAHWFFTQTDARGGYLSFLIFLALIPLVRLFAKSLAFRTVASLSPVLFTAFAFVIASWSDDQRLNEILSFRPFLLHEFLMNIGISDILLSRSVKQIQETVAIVRTVDNSYLHLIVGCGIVIAAVYFVAFYRAIRSMFAANRFVDISFLLATSIYFNSESILLRIENVFVIYAWYIVLLYSSPKQLASIVQDPRDAPGGVKLDPR